MKKILQYIKAHKVITGIIILIVAGGGYYTYTLFHKTTATPTYVLGKVTRGDLVVSVSGTGQVATLSKVDIKPQTTGQTQTLGQILQVNVTNGQTVKAGDVIAILDGKSALQSYNQAKASVASAQASYDKLVGGPTASDLQSYQNSIQSGQTSLTNGVQNLNNSLQSVYISASNLVFLNTDPFFSNPLSSPILTINNVFFTNQQLQFQVNNDRALVGTAIASWRQELNAVSSSTDPVALANDSISYLTTIRNYFNDMTTLFTSYSSAATSDGQSAINSDKSTAASALSSANSSITSLTSSLQSYQSAVINLQQSQTSLTLKKAPANPDDVMVAQAQLDNAKAALSTAAQTYASRIITAPFDGQIGGLTAQVGQQISSSDVLGTIITPQKVVNVSLNEVDAAKVTAGDSVILTFDALPALTIPGTVSYLDPLGTVSQGVVNYAVQIALNIQNDQIKTGMTASATIVTQTHPGVLMVPTSAVTTAGTRSFVLVPNSVSSATSTFATMNQQNFASTTASSTASTTRQRNFAARSSSTSAVTPVQTTVHPVMVTIGISNDTSTEIISGLTEGETIVTRTIAAGTASAATTARTGSIFGLGGAGGGAARTGGGTGGGVTRATGTASASAASGR